MRRGARCRGTRSQPVTVVISRPKRVRAEDVRDWGQTVVRLGGRGVVDLRRRGRQKLRRLAEVVAVGRRGLMPAAGKGLVERRRLDYPLVGELRGGGRHDGQAGGGCLHLRRRFRLEQVGFGGLRAVGAFPLGGFLQARLDDGALLVPDGDAALQLLAHGRVLGLEAGRQTCQADVLDGQVALAGGLRGAGGGCGGREIQLSRAMPGAGAGGGTGGGVGGRAAQSWRRRGFFLHGYFGRRPMIQSKRMSRGFWVKYVRVE